MDINTLSVDIYTFTLTVTKDTRTATSTVKITVISTLVPQVSVQCPFNSYGSYAQPTSTIIIPTTLTPVSSLSSITITWSYSYSGLARSTINTATFTSSSSISSSLTNLVMNSQQSTMFTGGVQYNFHFDVIETYKTLTYKASADCYISTGSKPQGGNVALNNFAGYALFTSYVITASNWYCNDGSSLSYSFYQRDLYGNIVYFNSYPIYSSSYPIGILPSGNIIVGVQVYSGSGSYTLAETTTVVKAFTPSLFFPYNYINKHHLMSNGNNKHIMTNPTTSTVVAPSVIQSVLQSAIDSATNTQNVDGIMSAILSASSTLAAINYNSVDLVSASSVRSYMLTQLNNIATSLSTSALLSAINSISSASVLQLDYNGANTICLLITSTCNTLINTGTGFTTLQQFIDSTSAAAAIIQSAVPNPYSYTLSSYNNNNNKYHIKAISTTTSNVRSAVDSAMNVLLLTLTSASMSLSLVAGVTYQNTQVSTTTGVNIGIYRFSDNVGITNDNTIIHDNTYNISLPLLSIGVIPFNNNSVLVPTTLLDIGYIYNSICPYVWSSPTATILSTSCASVIITNTTGYSITTTDSNTLYPYQYNITMTLPYNASNCIATSSSMMCTPTCSYFSSLQQSWFSLSSTTTTITTTSTTSTPSLSYMQCSFIYNYPVIDLTIAVIAVIAPIPTTPQPTTPIRNNYITRIKHNIT